MTLDTPDGLLKSVRASKVVAPERLEAWLAANPAPPGEDAERLAGRLAESGLLTHFQAKLLLKGKVHGFFIAGKYKVLDLLGKGGMGSVYLCEHTNLKTAVAVKVLPVSAREGKEGSEDAETRERFYREARAFATLNHPNLVRGFDVDTDGKIHYIVMEYIDGVDLQALTARRGPLPPARAASYARQAALGLGYAHAQGWVHRDIKPANVVVDRAGLAKVLDMGLARLVADEADGVTRKLGDGSVLGTADYLAPEQATGLALDGRADIYALGATLYFMLTGRVPFEGGTTAQKLLWHQLSDPPPIRDFRPDVPERLSRVVEAMMAKLPEDRPPTAFAVAEMLAPFDAGGPFPPDPAELPSRLPPGLSAAPSSGGAYAATSALSPTRRTSGLSTGQVRLATRAAAAFAGRAGRKRLPAWALGAGAALALALGGLAYYVATDGPPPRPPSPVVPPPAARPSPFVGNYVAVTRAHGPGQVPFPGGHAEYLGTKVYPSVSAAVADPRLRQTGCRVLLLDEVHEEQASIDAAKLPPGTSIESARVEPPTQWLPPEVADAARPLLRLSGGAGLAVRNLAFDGAGRVETTLLWANPGPGCRLEAASVTRFTAIGVAIESAAGAPGNPVVLSKLRAHPDSPAPAEAAVAARGGARHLRLEDCRLEGPAAGGLACDGGADELELVRCRLFAARYGARFAGAGPLRATLDGCAFARLNAAVDVEAAPADARLTLRGNLFFGVTPARFADPSHAAGVLRDGGGNVTTGDGAAPPGLTLGRRPGLVTGLDPADDAGFLRATGQ